MRRLRTRPQLLDWPPVGAAEYAAIEDAYQALLGTTSDLAVVQGEAILALEAAARGLGCPGRRVLNLVSGPYGDLFGSWLAASGAEVRTLAVSFDRAVRPETVAAALDEGGPFDVVSLVHAEAATGVVNDLQAIAGLARAGGALVVVDAVASVGAEPLMIDALELDLVVLGAHKALAGPAGATGVVIGERAWEMLASAPAPWRHSSLSLLDWRERWQAPGRNALWLIPNHLETRALGEAIERVGAEGLEHVVGRHRAAAAASRAALEPLELRPWVDCENEAASIATLIKAPRAGAAALLETLSTASPGLSAPITLAPGSLAGEALRISHTGLAATLPDVLAAVVALAGGMAALGGHPRLDDAVQAAVAAWQSAPAR